MIGSGGGTPSPAVAPPGPDGGTAAARGAGGRTRSERQMHWPNLLLSLIILVGPTNVSGESAIRQLFSLAICQRLCNFIFENKKGN